MFEHFEKGEGGDVDLLGGIEGGRIRWGMAQRSTCTSEHPLKPLHARHENLISVFFCFTKRMKKDCVLPLFCCALVNVAGNWEEEETLLRLWLPETVKYDVADVDVSIKKLRYSERNKIKRFPTLFRAFT